MDKNTSLMDTLYITIMDRLVSFISNWIAIV